MANTIQFKLRVSGNAGAPASLKSGEVAHNEVDDTLYIGKGDDGSGRATSVIHVAGRGAFVDATTSQAISGRKTFSSAPRSSQDASGSTDLVRKAKFDNGLADKADASHGHNISDVSGLQGALDGKAANSHGHAISDVSGLQAAINAKAPLASPALSGTPTAPNAAAGTNTTQIANTAFVQAAISALIDAAPGALDTLNELAASLGDDPDFAATVTNGLASKLSKSSNLSDLTSAGAARENLGLGTMATQSSNSVSISGGAINGINFDFGTF